MNVTPWKSLQLSPMSWRTLSPQAKEVKYLINFVSDLTVRDSMSESSGVESSLIKIVADRQFNAQLSAWSLEEYIRLCGTLCEPPEKYNSANSD